MGTVPVFAGTMRSMVAKTGLSPLPAPYATAVAHARRIDRNDYLLQ
jgi:hypothetical protein